MGIAPNRKVLITGGASGFGFDIARSLIAAGAQVAIVDHSAEGLANSTQILGDRCFPINADVRIPSEVAYAVDLTAKKFEGLDTLVISAGVIHIKPLTQVSESDWDLTMDVNLKGAFLVIQASAKYLSASGRGRIVAISSDAGKRGFSQIQAYCASKFGLIGLIESCASELAISQVTANCVCPVGCPTTSMGLEVLNWKMKGNRNTSEKIMKSSAQNNPLGRNATETDVTGAVNFFISDEAAFLTGSSLDVDGGAHLGGSNPGSE